MVNTNGKLLKNIDQLDNNEDKKPLRGENRLFVHVDELAFVPNEVKPEEKEIASEDVEYIDASKVEAYNLKGLRTSTLRHLKRYVKPKQTKANTPSKVEKRINKKIVKNSRKKNRKKK